MKKRIALACLGIAVLSSAGCQTFGCTAVGCADTMTWEAELPDGLTLEQARVIVVRACRNGVCFERSFDDIAIDSLAPNSGAGLTISPTAMGDAGVLEPVGPSYVLATLWATADGYRIMVSWNDAGVADGDVYEYVVTSAAGDRLAGYEATAVEYRVFMPNGPDCPPVCREASLEGSTQ